MDKKFHELFVHGAGEKRPVKTRDRVKKIPIKKILNIIFKKDAEHYFWVTFSSIIKQGDEKEDVY